MAKKKKDLEDWPKILKIFKDADVDIYVDGDQVTVFHDLANGLTDEMKSALRDHKTNLKNELKSRRYYIPFECSTCSGRVFWRTQGRTWEPWICKQCHPPVIKAIEEAGEEPGKAVWPQEIQAMIDWLEGFDIPPEPFGLRFTVNDYAYEGVSDPGRFKGSLLAMFMRYGPGQGPHRYGRPEEDLRFVWDKFGGKEK